MKKRIFSLISACIVAFSFSACGEKEQAVKIKSDEEPIHLAVGDEISVTAQMKKSEAIKWSCEDTDVAVITTDGKLSGVSNGITVITARTDSGSDSIGLVVGNGVKGTETVVRQVDKDGNVTSVTKRSYNQDSKITNIQLSLNGMTEDETLILGKDDEAYLKVSVTPSDCDDTIYFESSDSSVCDVDSEGTVYPVGKGTATITATAPNGVSDTFKIFVRN